MTPNVADFCQNLTQLCEGKSVRKLLLQIIFIFIDITTSNTHLKEDNGIT